MSTGTLPYTYAPAPATRPAAASEPSVGFWRAPFAAATYREIGYALASLPVAIAGFVFAVTMLSLSAGLAVTAVGLPLLVATLATARGFGAFERGRARLGLGLHVTGPAPVKVRAGSGWWAGMLARVRDAAGWKALLFQVVMFPWRVATFSLTLTVWLTGWAAALYPAYHWVFPTYVDWPGYQLYDYYRGDTHHAFYLDSVPEIAGASALGLVIVFLTPLLVRGLTSVDRAAVRGLLS